MHSNNSQIHFFNKKPVNKKLPRPSEAEILRNRDGSLPKAKKLMVQNLTRNLPKLAKIKKLVRIFSPLNLRNRRAHPDLEFLIKKTCTLLVTTLFFFSWDKKGTQSVVFPTPSQLNQYIIKYFIIQVHYFSLDFTGYYEKECMGWSVRCVSLFVGMLICVRVCKKKINKNTVI